jgi:hypothetical protein
MITIARTSGIPPEIIDWGDNDLSKWDLQALEAIFDGWKKERAPSLQTWEAFERFSAENLLRDADLTDEEITSGLFGGSDDGGVDGMFLFINRILMLEETEVPERVFSAELVIFQSKHQDGFGEDAVEKMYVFVRDLLDYTKDVDSFTYLNTSVRDAMASFREKYTLALSSNHTFDVRMFYISKSQHDPHAKAVTRSNSLKALVRKHFSAATVTYEFWDASRLLQAVRTVTKKNLTMDYSRFLTADDGAVVCLVKLRSYADFLTDEHGTLRKSLLEPNVRDYQGRQNPVNADIRATLAEGASGHEFWWLNNGVTILAANCSIAGDKLMVESPEVVNGLQTSQEIFSYFNGSPKDESDKRCILVRIVTPTDEQTRTKVIKATNSQTSVEPLSLHATDQIHFDIEDKLKMFGLYYDRRKRQYRNMRMPVERIISMRAVAQAVMAILLRQPSSARARPMKVLNDNSSYIAIFGETNDRDLYVVCTLIDRQVGYYLDNHVSDADVRRDIRYYVDLWIACELAKKPEPLRAEIVALKAAVVLKISDDMLAEATKLVTAIYKAKGGNDKAAKGSAFQKQLILALGNRHPPKSRVA